MSSAAILPQVNPHLEQLQWAINNSTDVNPVPASVFLVDPYPGGMTTTIEGPAYAGALARTPDIPLVEGATAFILSYLMKPTGNVSVRAQALEFDIMISGPTGDVYNGSCQCVVADSWAWQIVQQVMNSDGTVKDQWIPTGFTTPAETANGGWIEVTLTVRCDFTVKTCSVISIEVNNTTHTVDASLQNVPAFPLAWAPNVIVVQRQLDVNAGGGAFSVDDENISLTQAA